MVYTVDVGYNGFLYGSEEYRSRGEAEEAIERHKRNKEINFIVLTGRGGYLIEEWVREIGGRWVRIYPYKNIPDVEFSELFK